MAVTKVVMPKLSDAMESGKIIKWLKKEGDRIQGGDILAEVETDKADVEMEAFGAGVLRKILVPAGTSAPIGTLIGVIAEPGDDIAALVASAPGGSSSASPGSGCAIDSASAGRAAGFGRRAGFRRGWRKARAGRYRFGAGRRRSARCWRVCGGAGEGFAAGEEDRGADRRRPAAHPGLGTGRSHHPS